VYYVAISPAPGLGGIDFQESPRGQAVDGSLRGHAEYTRLTANRRHAEASSFSEGRMAEC